MVTVNQITPIPIPSLSTAATLTGNEVLPISQLNTTVKVSVNTLPQGMTAGVVTFGTTGGSPFPNFRTLKAGHGVSITDGGAQGDLTLAFNGSTVSIAWGNITGTLSNQTDLQAALDGKLAVANNLSDVSDSNIALNNILPSQGGNSGKFLITNGTNTDWDDVPASSPGGSDTQIQFNDSNSFGGATKFDWDKSNEVVKLDALTAPGAPAAALAGAGAGNLSIFSGYQYGITFSDVNGNETLLGILSGSVNVTDPTTNGKINLTSIPLGTNSRITGRNIYRNVSADPTAFYVVARLADNTTTIYTDNTSDAQLSLNILSNDYSGNLTASVISPPTIGLNITSSDYGDGNLTPITIGSSYGQLGRNAIAIGIANEIPAFDAYAFGSSNIVSSRSCMSLGNSNLHYGPGESFAFGDNNLIVSNGGCISFGFDNELLGASSYVLGDSSFAGIGAACTISGTTVTISGDKTAYFSNGGEVAIYSFSYNGLTPYYFTRSISAVSFGGGNTTFTLDSVISSLVTSAHIVQYNHAVNQNNIVIGGSSFSQGGKSISIGDSNFVTGASGVAIGNGHSVTASFSTAMGQSGTVSGAGSFLVNLGTTGSTTVSTNNVFVIANGNTGLGTTAPTAVLHLKAGSTTTAPFKLSSGTNLTSPAAGAMEFDGTSLTFTPSSTRKTIGYTDFSNATGTLSVANGGTGGTTFSSLALIKGNGTSALSATGISIDDTTNAIYGYKAKLNSQTTTAYTIATTDTGKIIEFNNGSAITATLPNNLGTGFSVTCTQTGAGQVTFSPAAGATLNNASSFTKTRAQYSFINLYVTTNSTGTNATYLLGGDGA